MTATVGQKAEGWTWEGDLYNRGAYAKFLTDYLRAKTLDGEKPFCMALDADWGAGKTFFVDHWIATLNKQGAHLSFKFNAWEADFQADPLIAFMAEFKAAIENRLAQPDETASDDLREQVKLSLNSTAKKFGKLWAPMSKAVLRGITNKVTAGAAEELAEIWQGDDGLVGDAIKGVFEGGSDYINTVLDEQIGRKQLLEEFKESITTLLDGVQALSSEQRLPVFIFVDELDRCRPSFAVELLEGIKHIFNTEGLCFVVATNISQLSHAVTAIYGSGFDGRSYLDRFFDSIHTLPASESIKHIDKLISGSAINKHDRSRYVVTSPFTTPSGAELDVNSILKEVAGVFNLTPRLQEKYIMYIDAAAAALSGSNLHIWWLAILAAAKVKNKVWFDILISTEMSLPEKMREINLKSINKTIFILYDNSPQGRNLNISVGGIIEIYMQLYGKTVGDVHGLRNSNQNQFADYFFALERTGGSAKLTSVSNYPWLIDCAGHISPATN